MDARLIDRRIRCPFCSERMDIVIDPSAGSQSYIEDCQVCCQPMQISFTVDGDDVFGPEVDRAS